jgi:uncharacterized protein (DUF302 family)
MAKSRLSILAQIPRQGRRQFLKQSLSAGLLFYLPLIKEFMINPKGIVIKNSLLSVEEITDGLLQILKTKGATIYAVIDQQKELSGAGIDILPMRYVLFGNPRTGGPVLLKDPVVGLDLPLKVLIWQADATHVHIAYNDKVYLQERYKLSDGLSELLNLTGLINAVLNQQ